LVSKDGAYSFDIHAGTNTVGRRETDNDIVIPDPYCSGRHADLAFAEGKFTLTDVGSTNGTFVNGVKLDANAPRDLVEGDEITLGRTVFAITETRKDGSTE
jgi:pSer/pThr/pTyr-binding forkhead associated (FHA) protein